MIGAAAQAARDKTVNMAASAAGSPVTRVIAISADRAADGAAARDTVCGAFSHSELYLHGCTQAQGAHGHLRVWV
jgi:hypothetical protein